MNKIVKVFFVFVIGLGLFASPSIVYAEESVQPGEEWDGEIKDPAGTEIVEPVAPVEPAPAPAPTPTPTPAPTPAPAPKPSYVAPVIAEEPATTPSEPEVQQEAPETPQEIQKEEEPETPQTETSQDEPILVPETARPHTNQKISLMAIVSTGIVVFSAISIWAGIKAFKLHRHEKIYQEAIQKSEIAKKAHINRAG